MSIMDFWDISLLQIWESFSWTFMGSHENVPYFILPAGVSSEVINCFTLKLLPAAIHSCGLAARPQTIITVQSAKLYIQHSLTLTWGPLNHMLQRYCKRCSRCNSTWMFWWLPVWPTAWEMWGAWQILNFDIGMACGLPRTRGILNTRFLDFRYLP